MQPFTVQHQLTGCAGRTRAVLLDAPVEQTTAHVRGQCETAGEACAPIRDLEIRQAEGEIVECDIRPHVLRRNGFRPRRRFQRAAPAEAQTTRIETRALHGVLHGGADQAALETADRVGSPERAAEFVDRCLATGEKVMGMGHREYKVVDPRAVHLKRLAEQLTAGTEHEVTFRTLQAIEARFTERMAEQGKDLYANVEFYKGLVFRVLGLPPRFFTALFGMARVFGYLAHFAECRQDNRIVRPQAHYVGPRVGEPGRLPATA